MHADSTEQCIALVTQVLEYQVEGTINKDTEVCCDFHAWSSSLFYCPVLKIFFLK
jgi:hypothetical protein